MERDRKGPETGETRRLTMDTDHCPICLCAISPENEARDVDRDTVKGNAGGPDDGKGRAGEEARNDGDFGDGSADGGGGSVRCPGCDEEYPLSFRRDLFVNHVVSRLRSAGLSQTPGIHLWPERTIAETPARGSIMPPERDPLNAQCPAGEMVARIKVEQPAMRTDGILFQSGPLDGASTFEDVPRRLHRELLGTNAPQRPDAMNVAFEGKPARAEDADDGKIDGPAVKGKSRGLSGAELARR
jgi:hypothetical protein